MVDKWSIFSAVYSQLISSSQMINHKISLKINEYHRMTKFDRHTSLDSRNLSFALCSHGQFLGSKRHQKRLRRANIPSLNRIYPLIKSGEERVAPDPTE